MIAIAAVLGGGIGLGVVLIVAGFRGQPWTGRLSPWRRLRLVPRRLATGVACGFIVGIATGWPVAALFAVALGLVMPNAIRRHRAQSRAASRIEAIAAWSEMLRDAMAGAAGLESALVATAPAAPLAIRSDVQALAASLTGERIGTALRHFADRVADPTCDLVVAALLMAAEHQGRHLGELLGALAASAREDAAMRLRVEAGRAQIRGDLQIIVITVFGFVTMLLLVDRGYYTPYDSPLGQLVLAAIAGIFAGALALLLRLARLSTPHRLLVARSEQTP
jgi:tight adherence protein B